MGGDDSQKVLPGPAMKLVGPLAARSLANTFSINCNTPPQVSFVKLFDRPRAAAVLSRAVPAHFIWRKSRIESRHSVVENPLRLLPETPFP
jgi:hypothetical protein